MNWEVETEGERERERERQRERDGEEEGEGERARRKIHTSAPELSFRAERDKASELILSVSCAAQASSQRTLHDKWVDPQQLRCSPFHHKISLQRTPPPPPPPPPPH